MRVSECHHLCALLLGMCFAKMRTKRVSLFGVWSNCTEAKASINARCSSNSADKSRAAVLLSRQSQSLSAAWLIWHCTRCSPFLMVNWNAINSGSEPTASPRVSGTNVLLSANRLMFLYGNGHAVSGHLESYDNFVHNLPKLGFEDRSGTALF